MSARKMNNKAKYQEFYERGYQVFPGVLTGPEACSYKKALDAVYKEQLQEFGLENMQCIQEENTVRAPFLYDASFVGLFYNNFTQRVVKDILGEYAILSLQNAILVPPHQTHHQGFYHRDIIHQNFVTSTPLGINLYYCLDDYTESNGATTFIPGSHREENLDAEAVAEIPAAARGSVILFDSMVYHKAGTNQSDSPRYGINNMYTLPFLKQQIRYASILPTPPDAALSRLLGFESKEYLSVNDFRQHRLFRERL